MSFSKGLFLAEDPRPLTFSKGFSLAAVVGG